MAKFLRVILLTVFLAYSLQFITYSCLYAQDKIIAVVNYDAITQKELDDFTYFVRLQLAREYSSEELKEQVELVRPKLLQQLIEDKLILQEAKKNDYQIEIAPKKFISTKPDKSLVEAGINEIRSRYPSEAVFKQELAKQGVVLADLEKKISEQLLMNTIIEFKVRDKIIIRPQEVTEFYQQNLKEFIAYEERDVEVIVLENESTAASLVYDLKRGQQINELAMRYPLTLNRIRDAKKGELRKEVEEAVFSLSLNQVSEPVKIDDKFYAFRLNNITPERQLKLPEVQDSVSNFLYNQKMRGRMDKWLGELKAKAYINIIEEEEESEKKDAEKDA